MIKGYIISGLESSVVVSNETKSYLPMKIDQIVLKGYQSLPLAQRVKENFKKDIWQTRLSYLKNSIQNYLGK